MSGPTLLSTFLRGFIQVRKKQYKSEKEIEFKTILEAQMKRLSLVLSVDTKITKALQLF